jgi:hypothetical protein
VDARFGDESSVHAVEVRVSGEMGQTLLNLDVGLAFLGGVGCLLGHYHSQRLVGGPEVR